MKLKIFTLLLLIGTNMVAQTKSEVKLLERVNEDCSKYRSLYYEYLKGGRYEDAAVFWSKAFEECGKINDVDSKFLANGRVLYTNLVYKYKDDKRFSGLKDTLCLIYEKRMLLEVDTLWIADYATFLVTYDDLRYEKIDSLWEKSIHKLKENTKPTHITTYFTHLINKYNFYVEDRGPILSVINTEYLTLSEYCSKAILNAKTRNDSKSFESYNDAQLFLDNNYALLISKDGETHCRHGQCNAIANSTGERCKQCVSNYGDTNCFEHK